MHIFYNNLEGSALMITENWVKCRVVLEFLLSFLPTSAHAAHLHFNVTIDGHMVGHKAFTHSVLLLLDIWNVIYSNIFYILLNTNKLY